MLQVHFRCSLGFLLGVCRLGSIGSSRLEGSIRQLGEGLFGLLLVLCLAVLFV